MSPTYQLLIYVEDDVDLTPALATPAAQPSSDPAKVAIPVYNVESFPHPTHGHTLQLPAALRARLGIEAPQ